MDHLKGVNMIHKSRH